ncbi:hypothetical protein QUF84_17940 [Fictibacillus enclensis]|uniref:hypothetical protein n=1 Tax=Fictibacillus enclensis TaxID=1017270 RepID=UPI0025A01C76|nr:hypothetical protein [Fictibacillus enclensis]MDM5339090.1 hypothetical protein [Fictibacillus enclensis]
MPFTNIETPSTLSTIGIFSPVNSKENFFNHLALPLVVRPASFDTRSIDVTPSLFVNEEVRDQIVNTINDYAKQQLEALIKQDALVIKTATDNIIKEHAEDIQADKSYDNYWKGKALGTRIDIDNAALTNKEDQFQIEAPVEFHYKSKEYNKRWDDDEPLEEEFNTDTVILTYNDQSKSWLISEINSNGEDEMKGNNVIKSKF